MEKSFLRNAALIFLGILFLAGCSTPESRIKDNPSLFASFPPDVQENVRKGLIDIGYTPGMVNIALGEPNRRYSRQTAEGMTEVWAYTATYTTTERQRVDGPFRVRTRDGSYQTVTDSAWADVQQTHEYEKLRVEFKEGKVSAIDRLDRSGETLNPFAP
jgi:PBP1b-binding outer membrane lipoprotein LpoB